MYIFEQRIYTRIWHYTFELVYEKTLKQNTLLYHFRLIDCTLSNANKLRFQQALQFYCNFQKIRQFSCVKIYVFPYINKTCIVIFFSKMCWRIVFMQCCSFEYPWLICTLQHLLQSSKTIYIIVHGVQWQIQIAIFITCTIASPLFPFFLPPIVELPQLMYHC